MDVRCPQCQTLYELDDAQLGRKAVTLKCSQCQHVFRLEGKSSVIQENQRRWMVRRQKEGDILYLNTFDVLHEWIMKQEVRAEDEISRTGDSWALLGEIGEFLPMFQVVASISALEETEESPDVSSIATRVPEKSEAPSATQKPNRERIRTAVQFGGEPAPSGSAGEPAEEVTKRARPSQVTPDNLPSEPEPEPETTQRRPTPGPQPAATPTPPRPARADDEFDVDLSRETDRPSAAESKSGAGPWVFLLVLVLAGAGAYVWIFQRDMLTPPEKEPEVVTIGASEKPDPSNTIKPTETLAQARDAALEAASAQNDAIWTMWHDSASKPFYVALDTAYAAADEASVGVELDEMLRDARVALENGQLSEANRSFRTVLAKDPSNPAAVTGLGWTLLEQRQADQAAAQFKHAMSLDSSYGDAYIGLGTAYRNLGQYRKAYDAYDLYLGRFPRGDKASIASYQMKQLKKQLGM